MTSQALVDWHGRRARAIDDLLTAHDRLRTGLPGRQTLTVQINFALITGLSSEFQGFARQLHDESIYAFVNATTVPDPTIRQVVRSQFASGRSLDRQNPTPGALGSDYKAFGLILWDSLEAMYGKAKREHWNTQLTRLNDARNAIAHNDEKKLAEVRAVQPLDLVHARKWRTMLNAITIGIDSVVTVHLSKLMGHAPW